MARASFAGILVAVAWVAPSAHAQAPPEGGAGVAVPGPSTPPAESVADVYVLLPTSSPSDLEALARSVDRALTEAALDLGIEAKRPSAAVGDGSIDTVDQEARAFDATVVGAELERTADGQYRLRIARASGESSVIELRVAEAEEGDIPLRAAVMLRDLFRAEPRASQKPSTVPRTITPGKTPGEPPLAARPHSEGRFVLAATATAFGGVVGFSLQKSSGSEDPRLLYPLMAVGASVGLGASLLAAEEWDVRTGDAWFMASAAFWPTLSGHLIYQGRFAENHSESRAESEQFTYGVAGGTAGVVLGTLALTLGHKTEGDALVSHSGGALGAVTGGLVELAARGDIETFPEAGIGYGAGLGWLGAAATAIHVDPAPQQVLYMDLGALLGGLAGASLASPLVFDDPAPDAQRAWAGITAGSTLLGAGFGAWLGWPEEPSSASEEVHGNPTRVAPIVSWQPPLSEPSESIQGFGLVGELP